MLNFSFWYFNTRGTHLSMLQRGLLCNNDFHLSLLSRENQLNLTMKMVRQANVKIICDLLRSFFYFSAVNNYLLSKNPSETGCASGTALSSSSIKPKSGTSGKTLCTICHQLQSKENHCYGPVIPLWTSECMWACSHFIHSWLVPQRWGGNAQHYTNPTIQCWTILKSSSCWCPRNHSGKGYLIAGVLLWSSLSWNKKGVIYAVTEWRKCSHTVRNCLNCLVPASSWEAVRSLLALSDCFKAK